MENVENKGLLFGLTFVLLLLLGIFVWTNYTTANNDNNSLNNFLQATTTEKVENISEDKIENLVKNKLEVDSFNKQELLKEPEKQNLNKQNFGILVETRCENGVCTTTKKDLSESEMQEMNYKLNMANKELRLRIEERIRNQQEFVHKLLKL